jgi:hypothetical protein
VIVEESGEGCTGVAEPADLLAGLRRIAEEKVDVLGHDRCPLEGARRSPHDDRLEPGLLERAEHLFEEGFFRRHGRRVSPTGAGTGGPIPEAGGGSGG